MTHQHLRIGSVPYLNAAPLVHFLDGALDATNIDASVSIQRSPPSQLSEALQRGELDIALMPVIDYLRGSGVYILPDISISCVGSVGSVLLFHQKPLESLSRVGLTTASRSSVALLKVLLKERWRVDARFEPLPVVPDAIPDDLDAMLLIGDDALTARKRVPADICDLGNVWHEWTGLPFVFAAWIVGDTGDAESLYSLLIASKEEGVNRLQEVIDAHVNVAGMTADEVAYYFTHNVNFDLGEEHIRGILRFQTLCHRCGILHGSTRGLTFWDPSAI
ncbi:MAG: hypothetical protein AUJ92_09475 [Armatimonadetes bacterium CG2_30_59_28]|nr:menaquinone biosynthesis protein [Armatimonadota bacterium]OIO94642.1 MAG: hypothetical protein AUJ92_09475 [Armatimonadetes bacterium CG2_30_59_28]PIU61651.1 MAG: hypothetical protein COS85_20635 [Armatimonadetes bacterium CG07_land_8_20_14_0_80_59_28]PIX40866.1 MAG: hypothetical protein COZ56_13580 [Armatimonadetes bacterium CG_4_8_14_3_um_filter_58_9]PIY44316.1 MAG: hypothetical protein COZ05_08420 [Armatimonadetes bacterium CG_4_10_14_3_um_filter_59_10]